MNVSKTASSTAGLSLAAALVLPAAPAIAAPAADSDIRISEIAYTFSTDFIEVAADPGTDISGWTFGSVTRGGSVQAQENTVTVPEDTTVGDSGAVAIDVSIPNSVKAG